MNYGSINSKIANYRRGIFSEKEYESIEKNSIDENIKIFLKNEIYKENFCKHSQNTNYFYENSKVGYAGSRHKIEHLLKKSEVNIIRKLIRYSSEEFKNFLEEILISYEIEDIKIIYRSIISREKLNIEEQLLTYDITKRYDIDKLANSSDLEDFLRNIKDTIFYPSFRIKDNERNSSSQFLIQMRLDRLYFLRMLKASEKLNKKDRNIIFKYLAKLIDIKNINILLRAKKYYSIETEEFFNYFLNNGYYINLEVLKNLAYKNNYEDVIKALKKTNLSSKIDFDKSILNINNEFEEKLFTKIKKSINYQNDITTFLRFYTELKHQNQRITGIVQRQKYDYSFN